MKYKIKEARKRLGWSQKQLAEEMGTSQQVIQRYEAGTVNPTSDKLVKISKILDVSVAYLLGLESPMMPTSKKMIGVPLYEAISPKMPLEAVKADSSYDIPMYIHEKHPDAFLLKVSGRSMDKVLPDGCYALIDPCKEIRYNDRPYAICICNFDATIRRVRIAPHSIELIPDSTDTTYHPQTYDYSDLADGAILVIGRVVWYCVPYGWGF